MSKLKAFLQPSVAGTTQEVIVSDRFKDEEGKPQPFVIQAISRRKTKRWQNSAEKTGLLMVFQ